jgi:hypothetical protein
MTASQLSSTRNPLNFALTIKKFLAVIRLLLDNRLAKPAVSVVVTEPMRPTAIFFGRYKHFTSSNESSLRIDRVLGPIADEMSKSFHLEEFVLDNLSSRTIHHNKRIFHRAFSIDIFQFKGIFSSGLIPACKKHDIGSFKLIVSLLFDGVVFLSARKSMKQYFRSLPCPSFALIDTWYSPDMMGIVSVLHEEKIVIVEVQHGYIHPKHAMYVDWPVNTGNAISLRPDSFWTWSDLAMNGLNIAESVCHTHNDFFVGGYPWTYQQIQKLKGDKTFTEQRLLTKSHKVLITLGAPQTDGCEDLPEALLRVLENKVDISFVLLPHPNVPNFKEYLDLKFKNKLPLNVEVAAINSDVYSLLASCSHHITAMSTVALETPAFGVPSLIIGRIGVGLFDSLIDNKWLFATESNEQVILDFLSTNTKGKKVDGTYIESSLPLLLSGIEKCKVRAKM